MEWRVKGKNIEDELNSIEVDIRSVKTGSGGTLSTAASTVYGVGSGTFCSTASVLAVAK